jgi:hypothetical protein
MENDRKDTFMNNEHEETGSMDLCEDSDNLGKDDARDEEVAGFSRIGGKECRYDWSVEHDDEVWEDDTEGFRDLEENDTNDAPVRAQGQDEISREIDRLEEEIKSGQIEDIEEAEERLELLIEIQNSCIPYRLSDDEL